MVMAHSFPLVTAPISSIWTPCIPKCKTLPTRMGDVLICQQNCSPGCVPPLHSTPEVGLSVTI